MYNIFFFFNLRLMCKKKITGLFFRHKMHKDIIVTKMGCGWSFLRAKFFYDIEVMV